MNKRIRNTVILALLLFALLLTACGKETETADAARGPDEDIIAQNHGILKPYCGTEESVNGLNELLIAAYRAGKLDDIEVLSVHWENHVPSNSKDPDKTNYNDYLVLEMACGIQCWALDSYGTFYAVKEGSPNGRLLSGIIE